ncbi:hypothetical protein [Oceanirhabdus seepicola]|uniref:Lipoprotein n=1 Tax=Oceanirhabdus seepicola TaxID=2828781 RepID=A0A9J6NWR8_9CLOT|nr:hypothetical protein [Oceanirhabdus seepicola]MCM1988707.1 hypothetical protein [Oceanirhabdus seepicola]
MNLRKILTIAFVGVLSAGIFVGCGNTKENILNNESSKKEIKVDVSYLESNKNMKEEITEESSLKIAIDGFKKYFDEEFKKEDFQVYEAHLSSKYETKTFNVESYELVQTDYDEYSKYRATINGITGEIKSMGCLFVKEAKDYNHFDVEKGKSIAIDFIKEHNLLDVDKIEFIDDLTDEEKEFNKKEPHYFYRFKAENGSLVIRVDKVDCIVGLFDFQQPITMED